MRICEQRTIIITGAGGGLGRAYALAFGQAGANVVVNDIRLEAAESVATEVLAAGGKPWPIKTTSPVWQAHKALWMLQ